MNKDFEKAIAFNPASGKFFVMADWEVSNPTVCKWLADSTIVTVPKHYDDEAIQDYLDHYGYTK